MQFKAELVTPESMAEWTSLNLSWKFQQSSRWMDGCPWGGNFIIIAAHRKVVCAKLSWEVTPGAGFPSIISAARFNVPNVYSS